MVTNKSSIQGLFKLYRIRPYSVNEKIDICRCLFSCLVVSAHALEMAAKLDPTSMQHLRPWLHNFVTYGAGTGLYYVMGFFVISGYCIQLSVTRLSDQLRFPLRVYLLARLTRILPLYYLALFTTVLVEAVFKHDRIAFWSNGLNRTVLVSQMLMVQNLTETYGSFAPSWSITNELVYYIMFGLLAALLAGSMLRPATVGLASCIVLGGITQTIYRLGYHSVAILNTGLIFGLGFNWFLGASIALHAKTITNSLTIRKVTRLWVLILAATILLWCTQSVHLEFIYLGSGIAFAFMLAQFLITDTTLQSASRNSAASLPTLLGLGSYPIYLFHGSLLLAVGSIANVSQYPIPWWIVWVAGVVFSIGFGLILGYVLERPIMTWRSYYLKRLLT